MVFDAIARRLQSAPHLAAAGLITTNNEFLRQLFVSKSGTSFSTPMLANKAARLLRRFPNASANLLKSLMAGAAQMPEECSLVSARKPLNSLNQLTESSDFACKESPDFV